MKASVAWLRELAPGVSDSAEEIARRLTSVGLEVESIAEFGAASRACLIARVVSVRPHPTKSGLRLVTVDHGGASQEVVCGAPNVPVPGSGANKGDLVVLAPLGATLPAKGVTIARREIAGVASEGMLCSESELGLGDGGEGILVFPRDFAKPGVTLAEALPASHDWILEIGLTPNRPDCLGHVGLARELAAIYNLSFGMPSPGKPLAMTSDAIMSLGVTVRVDEPTRCPHYGAAAVVDINVGPSSLAVQYRLNALGIRSISNLVDVTNWLMMLYGQPMHAFDLDTLAGNRIVVRCAKDGERMTTLDGVERTLHKDDLVICDADKPIALAGVMGGATSEVTEKTKRVLLECAYFEPRGVRRAGRRHGIHTESSHRFERGVDRGGIRHALAHATHLTTEVAPGSCAVSGELHVEGAAPTREKITMRSSRLDMLSGLSVPFADAKSMLERLGCTVTSANERELTAEAPLHRPDLLREVDLIEEIVRHVGIDHVPTILPRVRASRAVGGREALVMRARNAAVGAGYSEAVTYAFTSPEALEKTRSPKATVILQNPLSALHSVMRTSLLPSLLDVVSHAVRHGQRSMRLFTLGNRYEQGENEKLPVERATLACVLVGEREGYLTKAEPHDVWDISATTERVVHALTGRRPTLEPTRDIPFLHPRGAARVNVGEREVGRMGPIHPDVREAYDVAGDIFWLEIDLDVDLAPAVPTYSEVARFPAVERDIALVLPESVRVGEVLSALSEVGGPLVTGARVFDRFVGGAIPPGHASFAFRMVYQSTERTLTDDEVERAHAAVVAAAETRFAASQRK